ncbi:hypothetical protein LTR85_004511 [Meristemomyces frigidus]|nr:hypothetical protein LTR85_004511 [Meristemomyces frigidus]
MEAKDLLALTEDDAETMQHLSDLLHLFHHRNKNQHRRSVWWRHFEVFRKQLKSISTEVKDQNEVPSTHLARTKKKAKDQYTLQRIEQRLSFWQDVAVRKWEHAFSQLTADGRFAVLGLVLLAALAEVCRILGITAAFEDLGQAEVEKVLERFANEDWEYDGSPDGQINGSGEDFGEVISRGLPAHNIDAIEYSSKVDPTKTGTLPPQPVPTTAESVGKRKVVASSKVVKKKRRKGNAIDDLFSGFG